MITEGMGESDDDLDRASFGARIFASPFLVLPCRRATNIFFSLSKKAFLYDIEDRVNFRACPLVFQRLLYGILHDLD